MGVAASRRLTCSMRAGGFGVVFDIDGVLLRGTRSLPGARWAIEQLQLLGIPYALLTNGGGIPESKKRAAVERALGVNICGEVILAHSPMRTLVAPEYASRRTLILGHREELSVARSYGFQKTVTPQVLAAQHPLCYHGWGRTHDTEAARGNDPFVDERVEAIVVMHDPVDYHLELQVCIDVLRGRYPEQAVAAAAAAWTPPRVFNSNEDVEFSSPFPHPRLAQGAFLTCLEVMHEKCGGAPGAALDVVRFGKPHEVTFRFCEAQLPGASRFYMIGDNPAADIRGSTQAGENWKSVLVLSGMSSADSEDDPADFVLPDVGQAVKMILAREGMI